MGSWIPPWTLQSILLLSRHFQFSEATASYLVSDLASCHRGHRFYLKNDDDEDDDDDNNNNKNRHIAPSNTMLRTRLREGGNSASKETNGNSHFSLNG